MTLADTFGLRTDETPPTGPAALPALTDFSAFTDEQLAAMVHAGNPVRLREVAQVWNSVAVGLDRRAGEIEDAFGPTGASLRGSSADQYVASVRKLAAALRAVSELGALLRDHVYAVTEWLEVAQAMLPGSAGRPIRQHPLVAPAGPDPGAGVVPAGSRPGAPGAWPLWPTERAAWEAVGPMPSPWRGTA
jgi:hypothetical protein